MYFELTREIDIPFAPYIGLDIALNPGERRVTIYRYDTLWASTRFGFEYSQPLLDSLTPERRKI